MKLHRFFGDFDFRTPQFTIVQSALRNQLENVLRLEPGESILLCDGKGGEALAKIIAFDKNAIDVKIEETHQNMNEPAIDVLLYCAILKRENFEFVVQKATEIGVKEIIPILTQRTVKLDLRKDRLQKIIQEAAEQSGRGMIPILHEPMRMKDAIEDARLRAEHMVFFELGEENFQPQKIQEKHVKNIAFFIGPEGGWEASEVQNAREKGFHLASLGKTTLRGETAAIVAVYMGISCFAP